MKTYLLTASLAVMTTSVLEASFIDINRSNSNRSSTQRQILRLSSDFQSEYDGNSDRSSMQRQGSKLRPELRELLDKLYGIIQKDDKDILELLKEKYGDLNEKARADGNWNLIEDIKMTRWNSVKESMQGFDQEEIANVVTWDYFGLLSTAVEQGHINIAQLLLKQEGVYVNLQDDKGYAVLHFACAMGYKKMVEFLLNLKDAKNDYVVKVNLQDDGGYAPLHVACNKGHKGIVELLLNHDADVNLQNNEGLAPLHVACDKGHKGIVELLLNHDADVNLQDKNGNTPLSVACNSRGHEKIVELLLNLKDAKNDHVVKVNLSDKYGNAPLHVACAKNHEKIVELLLNHDADANLPTNDRDTPLQIACYYGHKGIVELLLNLKDAKNDYVVKVNLQNNEGRTSLNIACAESRKEIVELLLAHGADANLQDNEGETPLYSACRAIRKKTIGYETIKPIVQTLLAHGAKINLPKKNGRTPLYITCLTQNENLINLLIDNGATVDDKIRNLIKPYAGILRTVNQAEKRRDQKSQPTKSTKKSKLKKRSRANLSNKNSDKETLIQQEKKIDNQKQNNEQSHSDVSEETINSFFENISKGNLEQAKTLLNKKPTLINAMNEHNRTPLVAALAEKKFDIAKFLLTQKEINLTSKDIYGNSALMYAAKNKYPAIVEDILKKISTPSEHILEQNNEGKDSLGLAMLKPSEFSKLKTEQKSKVIKNRKKVMELLLNHLSSEDKSEEMFFAIKNNLWDMAEMILNSGVDINKKDGSTPPLILALKTKERDDKEKKLAFIKALIANKDIRLDAEDENECTALSYAVYNQYWEIVELLIGEKVKISFKLVEEIKDQMILDQIIQLDLKPYIEKKSELAIKDNNKEQVNNEQKQERYKLKFMNSSLKTYNGSNFDKNIKEGIDDIIKSLKIDPYKIANESLAGNYGLTNFGNNGYVRLYSAHPNSTKGGRVAYVVIEKLKEVWIIEANNKHHNFMKKHTRLKDILNGIFVDFDLEDNKKKALDDHLTENDATVIDMSSDEEDIDLFDSSITYQTRDIAQYLIEHDISANEYVRFLQNIMDQIKKK